MWLIIDVPTNGVCCVTRTSKDDKKVCQWLSLNQPINDISSSEDKDCDVITIKLENGQLKK